MEVAIPKWSRNFWPPAMCNWPQVRRSEVPTASSTLALGHNGYQHPKMSPWMWRSPSGAEAPGDLRCAIDRCHWTSHAILPTLQIYNSDHIPYPTENFKHHAKNNSFFARPSPFCLSPKLGPQFLLYHLRCFGRDRVNSELAIKQAVLLDSEMLCTYKTPRRRRGANRNGEVYLQLASLTGSKFLLHM